MTTAVETLPPQHQDQQPGMEKEMTPQPQSSMAEYVGSRKLENLRGLGTHPVPVP